MRAVFTSTTTNPDVVAVEGEVRIIRQLGPDEVDGEVGPMYRIRNVANGAETDAFEDELVFLPKN